MIIKDLCRRHKITEAQAREIIMSEFRVVKSTIESYSFKDRIFENIRLPKFGVFFVKPNKKTDED